MSDARRDHIGRSFRTLEHCALHRKSVTVVCRACDHTKVYDAVALWWLFSRRSWGDLVSNISQHLYCGECWSKRVKKVKALTVTITDDTPTGVQPPYPDERVWNRVVSRYRS